MTRLTADLAQALNPRPKRTSPDEIVKGIDVGLQRARNWVTYVGSSETCWRCFAVPASDKNTVELCDPCFEELRG